MCAGDDLALANPARASRPSARSAAVLGQTIGLILNRSLPIGQESARPVKMVMTPRRRDALQRGRTMGCQSTVNIAATKDGKIVAAQGTFYLQPAVPGLADPSVRAACSLCPLLYHSRASVGFDVVSNRSRSRPIARRAPTSPMPRFVLDDCGL